MRSGKNSFYFDRFKPQTVLVEFHFFHLDYLYNRLAVSMATWCNSFTDSDLELAMKLQAEEYSKSSFTIPKSSSHHPRLGNVASILTDAAIAAELQAEENAQPGRLIRPTTRSLHQYQQLSDISIQDDAAIAAELQAEENTQPGLLIRSMVPSAFHLRQLNAPSVDNDEFIAIRLQPEDYVEEQLQTIPWESSDNCHNSPDVPFDFHSFQTYFDDLQHRQDDFTPNDYEVSR